MTPATYRCRPSGSWSYPRGAMSRSPIASMISTFRSVVRFRRFSWSATERRLARAASVADLRRIAKRRLPAGVFDYVDGGAGDELTMRRNRAAFARVEFRPRVLRELPLRSGGKIWRGR